MVKKINCKHGLDKKGEIEARKVKRKIIEREAEVIQRVRKLFEGYKNSKMPSFEDYLKRADQIYYSALKRLFEAEGEAAIMVSLLND